jgi:alkylation response protein AidB-like acyl-CoA dehydrogenase
MDFELTPEQKLVQTTARDFAQRFLAPRAAAIDEHETFPTDALRELAKLGLLGVHVPERLGGAEMGPVAYALALIEISAACASTSVPMAVTNMAAEILVEFGSDEQCRQHVPKLVGGEYLVGAFALSEPEAGSDAAALRTSAERRGNGWVLRGTKQWISSGDRAGLTIVWARTGGSGAKGISAFIVPGGVPGLHVARLEEKTGLRGSTTAQLVFDDVELSADALLGQEGQGFAIAMHALDGGRIGIGAQAVGLGRAAIEASRRYVRERKQFGRPIGDFQGVQWMLADSAVEIEAARLLVLRAAALKEAGQPFTREAAMAKLYGSEAANRTCDRAVQCHGGYGYIREFPVERYFRDVRVTTIYEGTSEVQRIVIARHLLKEFGLDGYP